MGKILPIIMLLVGVGAGIGAGIVLAPAPEDVAHAEGAETDGEGEHEGGEGEAKSKPASSGSKESGEDGEDPANAPEFVKINNQFVVPVVSGDQVEALVIVSLSLETEQGLREAIYAREPKIRDAFLQVLFDHSNMGGFQGAFTRSNNLDILRNALKEVAQREFGDGVYNVLIIEIGKARRLSLPC